jgi:hypothetical protein
MGKSRVAVTNTLRLLKLPKVVQTALVEEQITEGHARALLMLETPLSQSNALHQVIAHDMSVRQTEEYVRKLKGEKPAAKLRPAPLPDIVALEERLQFAGDQVACVTARRDGTSPFIFLRRKLNSLLTTSGIIPVREIHENLHNATSTRSTFRLHRPWSLTMDGSLLWVGRTSGAIPLPKNRFRRGASSCRVDGLTFTCRRIPGLQKWTRTATLEECRAVADLIAPGEDIATAGSK